MDSFTDVPNPLPNTQHFKVPFASEKNNEDISKDGAITVQYACTLHHQNAVKTSMLNISFLPLRTFEKRIA